MDGQLSGDVGEYRFAAEMAELWGARCSKPFPDQGVDSLIHLPPGQRLSGGIVFAQVKSSAKRRDDIEYVTRPVSVCRLREYAALPLPTFLVAAELRRELTDFYVADARVWSTGSETSIGTKTIRFPKALRLDDFTFALLWCIGTLDAALLADDWKLCSQLTTADPDTTEFIDPRHDRGRLLSQPGGLWLGSHYCASHILGHVPDTGIRPLFWSREQSGDEASLWLFFRHKLQYLRRFRELGATDTVRAFCIPEELVTRMPLWERLLILLAASLMQAYGIEVVLSPERILAERHGFVLYPGKAGIIADFVRSEGGWYVDVVGQKCKLRALSEHMEQVLATRVCGCSGTQPRLAALAEYLKLDWSWVSRRAAEYARFNALAFLSTRSRLIGLEGVRRACLEIVVSGGT